MTKNKIKRTKEEKVCIVYVCVFIVWSIFANFSGFFMIPAIMTLIGGAIYYQGVKK